MTNSLWKKFSQKPKLKNYVSSVVEVGYSQYGPTLGISGILSALTKMIYVNEMSLHLGYKKGEAAHRFEWFAFRSHEFNISSLIGIDLKMPSRFLLNSAQPFKYNILFCNNDHYSQINPIFKDIKKEWEHMLETTSPLSTNKDYSSIFSDFIQQEHIIGAANKLRDMSYWETGEYTVKMQITSMNPYQNFETQKSFVISPNAMESLQHNAYSIIADLCKLPYAHYCFFYGDLVK